MKRHLPLLALATLCLLVSSSVQARTWTETDSGRTLEGEFRQLSGDIVEIIRSNGTLVKVPLASLSEEDRTFVAEQEKESAASSSPTERPKVTHKEGEKLQVGDVIDLSFRSVNAGKVDLAEMKDKVVLLDFWATWCGPCIAELPNVKAAYEKYHDKGFEIVGISLDSDESRLEDFIEERDMPWPQHFDGGGWENELAEHYGIKSIPSVYLVQNNEVIAVGVRGSLLEEKLEELLD